MNLGTITTLLLAGYITHKGDTAVKIVNGLIVVAGLLILFFMAGSFSEFIKLIGLLFSTFWSLIVSIFELIFALLMFPFS